MEVEGYATADAHLKTRPSCGDGAASQRPARRKPVVQSPESSTSPHPRRRAPEGAREACEGREAFVPFSRPLRERHETGGGCAMAPVVAPPANVFRASGSGQQDTSSHRARSISPRPSAP